MNPFERKWETHQHISQYWQFLNLVANCVHFHVKWRKARHFDARTVGSFLLKRDWGSPCWPWMTRMIKKNNTNVYSIHLELRMALPCQISTGKWKYVNPCLDFLGIPDQRTAYVKRQARPRWTYVRRSSVTPDLVSAFMYTYCPIHK